MGRKGGGRAGFMRSVLHNQEDSEEEHVDQTSKSNTNKPADVSAVEKKRANKAAQFLAGQEDEEQEEEKRAHGEGGETRGQILQRHKKEQKSVKDQIKRLGKKGKEEAAALQAALDKRHQEELEAFDTAVKLQELTVPDEDSQLGKGPRMSKSMKRKQQRQQEEAEREARIEAELAEVGETARQREESAILEQLAPRGLAIHDIPADGHCLYRALEHQLRLRATESPSDAAEAVSKTPGYVELRRLAATYMREHDDDFRPFITEDDLTVEGESESDLLERYCQELESTAAWGGHLELEALSGKLDRPIAVFAADAPLNILGESRAGGALQVCFMHHAYGLGDHYNSVVPSSEVGDEEDRDDDEA